MPVHYYFLSLLQAATEFLPVSSSGHLLFFKQVFGHADIPVFFDIVLHVGSLTAILCFYRRRLVSTILDARRELSRRDKGTPALRFIIYGILSTAVTFVIYYLGRDFIEARFETAATLKYTYPVTSLLLAATYFSGRREERGVSEASPLLPILAGIFQAVAIIPGISRSGATISCLLFLRTRREEAAYYSFFLAIPAIAGAFAFKLAEAGSFAYAAEHWRLLAVSFIISTVFSYLFLKLLTIALTKKRFWAFSLYTAALAVISIIIF
ncbi:undecaprenyl-diphosphate phosphatase [bacterium]|nr:undecaprenyl-diphosphate phosphatase [bacterium]